MSCRSEANRVSVGQGIARYSYISEVSKVHLIVFISTPTATDFPNEILDAFLYSPYVLHVQSTIPLHGYPNDTQFLILFLFSAAKVIAVLMNNHL
jgi:hypothetical protein